MTRKMVGACLIVLLAASAAMSLDPEAEYTRGLVAYNSGDYSRAISIFDEVLEQQPGRAPALYYRGLAKAKLNRYADAITDLKQAADRDPGLPVAGSIGAAYFELHQYDEATPWLRRAVDRGQAPGSANLALGIIAYEQNRYADADRYLVAAEGADPKVKGTAEFYRGLIARKQGRELEAKQAFKTAQATGAPEVAEAAARQLAVAAAGTQFSTVRSHPMPIPGAPPATLYAYTGFEYESNVVLEDTPFITNKASGRWIFGAGGDYRIIDNDMVRWDFAYDFYQNVHFNVSSVKLQGHTLRSSVSFGNWAVVPGLHAAYDAYLLGTDGYYQEVLGTPFLAIPEPGIGEMELFYRIRARDYLSAPFDPAQDAINHAVGLRQIFRFGPQEDRVFDIGYQWDRNDPISSVATVGTLDPQTGQVTNLMQVASGRDFDYEGNELDVGLAWPIPGWVEVDLRYGYRHEDYLHGNSRLAAVDAFLPDGTRVEIRPKRNDDSHYVVLGVTRDFTDRIYGRLGYRFRTNDSNVPVYSYDSHTVSATVGVHF